MFPISSDGVCEDPSIFCDQDKFLEDLLVDFPTSEGNELSDKRMKKRGRGKNAEIQENNEGSSDSKKSAHRFTEKQRRQEMAGLYASLRTLLPLEYIKGKRAISDHMHQAVNYINDMKNRIEEMQVRRDNLRKLCNVVIESDDQQHCSNSSHDCVKINLSKDGLMEILISSSLNKECFPLSMVLADFLARQLNVVSCVSTRGDRCYLHKIQIELNESTSNVDVSEIQEGVMNVIKLAAGEKNQIEFVIN